MLAFRSLDTFPPLREPDRRRRDEERPFRSKQGTGNKPKNHLTEKLPYRFESGSLQRRICDAESVVSAQDAYPIGRGAMPIVPKVPLARRILADVVAVEEVARRLRSELRACFARRVPVSALAA